MHQINLKFVRRSPLVPCYITHWIAKWKDISDKRVRRTLDSRRTSIRLVRLSFYFHKYRFLCLSTLWFTHTILLFLF
jgi:hypothetical protein